jgi:hypothetical protein
MNEKIKELELQCWEPTQYGPAWFNSTKFAELIIEECINICISNRNDDSAQHIEKHFGVEE